MPLPLCVYPTSTSHDVSDQAFPTFNCLACAEGGGPGTRLLILLIYSLFSILFSIDHVIEQLPDVEHLSLEATEQSQHAYNKPLTTPLAQVNIVGWSYINWGRGSE